MTTLSNLINKYGGNGYIRIDDGNGSAGPSWIEWDEDITAEYGDTEMAEVEKNTLAYGDTEREETLIQVATYVIPDYTTDELMFVSDWIEDDNRNYPYQAVNPYRYRIIF